MKIKVIFATNNLGKLKEVKSIFSDTNFEIISLKEIGFKTDIEETGTTFEANAFIKANTIFNQYRLPVIADDSGLMVDQLDGAPGVYSARYAGENVTYRDNNLKLLAELKKFSEPHVAKFVCCAVYVNGEKKESVIGELHGEIINEFRGENGFGFDPIFKPNGFDRTLAEMELSEKNKISHRAKAFKKLHDKLSTSQQ